jgi:hypothetical protein
MPNSYSAVQRMSTGKISKVYEYRVGEEKNFKPQVAQMNADEN